MSSQPAALVSLAMKLRADPLVAESGSGATEFNFSPSSGITPNMAAIQDDTIRRDGMAEGDGLGSRSGTASCQFNLSPAKQDMLWLALMRRSAWQTIPDITGSDVTSITTTTTTIVGASGSFLTLGLRRFMRIQLAGHSSTGNNGRLLNIVSVTASTITVSSKTPLTLNATPDTSFTISVLKYLTGSPTPTPQIIDMELWRTQQLTGKEALAAQVVKGSLATGANAKVKVTFDFMSDDFAFNTTGSRRFTSPTKGTGRNVVTSDGLYMRNGVDIKNIITDFGFVFDLSGSQEALLGPTVLTSTGLSRATGNFGVVSQDMAYLVDYYNKTSFDLMFVAEDVGSDPKAGMSFGFGNCLANSPTDGLTQTGLTKDTFGWSAGIDEAGGDRAATVMLITSTAP